MHKLKREFKLVFLLFITFTILCGCENNIITGDIKTIDNKELYNRLADNIPEIKKMQCILYEEISIENDEIDFPDFYKEYLEKSNKNEQRNKINTGAVSYILDSITEYRPSVRLNINEFIGRGTYYVFEFSSVDIHDFNRKSIKYTILINKEAENRIRIWKHINMEGYGTFGMYLPNYDIWDLTYEEINDAQISEGDI